MRVVRWLRTRTGIAVLVVSPIVLAVLAVLGVSLLAMLVGRAAYFETVIGPTPEQVEEHCQPVVDWILSEMDRTGRPPEQISIDHAARLNELPYTWRYMEGSLAIGRIDKEWPLPLYIYWWAPNEGWWWWADHPVSEVEVRRILEDHGYYR